MGGRWRRCEVVRLRREREPSAGNGRALTWNAQNLPTQVTSGGATTSFIYDGMGERVKKLSAAGTSYHLFGDDYEVTDGVVATYLAVPGLGVVAKRVGTGMSIQTFWLHTDRLGSINAITTDGSQYSAGTPVLHRTYAPYGETLSTTGTLIESRGWIDQRNDGETGLTYLHARYFDPKLGLFLSPDSLAPTDWTVGTNRYLYGRGSPLNGSDRSGHQVVTRCTQMGNVIVESTHFDTQTQTELTEVTVTSGCVAWETDHTRHPQ